MDRLWRHINGRSILAAPAETYLPGVSGRGSSVVMERSFLATSLIIGVLDARGYVRQIGGGVEALLGYDPAELLESQARSIVHHDDLVLLNGSVSTEPIELRLQKKSGDWLRTAVVAAPLHPHAPPLFGIVATLAETPSAVALEGRIAMLETRLRRIAAEVMAAQREDAWSTVLDPTVSELLSPRQFDIAERLVAGKRVPTIARDTGLSQSTVRNHLSQIFQKFGVGSQSELIDLLKPGFRPQSGAAPKKE